MAHPPEQGMNKLINQQIKLDERNHVEAPLLDQLKGLGWEVLAVPFIGERQLYGSPVHCQSGVAR